MIDWTVVITAAIPTVPATLAVVLGAQNRRAIRTPSGDTIGEVAERTHDLAAVATLSTAAAMGQKDAETTPPVSAGAGLDRAVERLNANPQSPVKVNGEDLH